MNDVQSKLLSRRRLLIAGGVFGVALTAVDLGWVRPRQRVGQVKDRAIGIAPDAKLTVVAFIGALHGRDLSADDIAELSDRLTFRLSSDTAFTDECAVLAQNLDEFASERGTATFRSCNDVQKDSIVQRIMTIDATSLVSKLLRRLSTSERNYYRMRWSTIYQLSWIYKQSGSAWRARGYRRWPGIPGDWREVLVPGAPYP